MIKNLPAKASDRGQGFVRSLGREDPLEEEMIIHSSTLAGESQGQRSLVGYRPWGHEESDMTEQLRMHTQYGSRWDSILCKGQVSLVSSHTQRPARKIGRVHR